MVVFWQRGSCNTTVPFIHLVLIPWEMQYPVVRQEKKKSQANISSWTPNPAQWHPQKSTYQSEDSTVHHLHVIAKYIADVDTYTCIAVPHQVWHCLVNWPRLPTTACLRKGRRTIFSVCNCGALWSNVSSHWWQNNPNAQSIGPTTRGAWRCAREW